MIIAPYLNSELFDLTLKECKELELRGQYQKAKDKYKYLADNGSCKQIREVLPLLADCYIKMNKPEIVEKVLRCYYNKYKSAILSIDFLDKCIMAFTLTGKLEWVKKCEIQQGAIIRRQQSQPWYKNYQPEKVNHLTESNTIATNSSNGYSSHGNFGNSALNRIPGEGTPHMRYFHRYDKKK